jgi:hypothetical protein
MTLSKSRFEELKERWDARRKSRGCARGSIVEVPADMADMADMISLYRGPRQPRRRGRSRRGRSSLRGINLVQELARLALEWGDRRFAQCARALFELGIVDKQKHRFTKKRGPHAVSLIDSAMDYAVAKVQALMKILGSEREACAKVAADLGWEAASFEAAIEHLRQASRQARKVGKRARG